jgi:hypothetical protein
MLELLKYITQDFFTFLFSTSFVCGVILSTGWSLNAIILAFKGVKAEVPEI